ncbi:hypothetical protein DIPPA_30318 [Diplonema papillatum]|nr:hypothetical protein DIPPA_30318 [Diplonema papillatum]
MHLGTLALLFAATASSCAFAEDARFAPPPTPTRAAAPAVDGVVKSLPRQIPARRPEACANASDPEKRGDPSLAPVEEGGPSDGRWLGATLERCTAYVRTSARSLMAAFYPVL